MLQWEVRTSTKTPDFGGSVFFSKLGVQAVSWTRDAIQHDRAALGSRRYGTAVSSSLTRGHSQEPPKIIVPEVDRRRGPMVQDSPKQR